MTACMICDNRLNNKHYHVKEMMFDCGEAFDYMKCGQCGCLQLIDVPDDLSKYYPSHYWDFQKLKMRSSPANQLQKWLRHRQARYWITCKKDFFGRILTLKKQLPKHLSWIKRGGVSSLNAEILDVGSGVGDRLLQLQKAGFKNLTGIDPFIEKDIDYQNGVVVFKKSLFETQGTFDFITLHHSFEHMPDQQEVLNKLYELIKPGCRILIRIPVSSSHAWEHYGVHWFQIDAPRHLFIHSEDSLSMIVSRAGLKLVDTVYDSNAEQFWASEQYMRGISLMDERSYEVSPEHSIFSEGDILEYRRKARELNCTKQGDQACFYIEK